jgi:hypothetical protein
MAAVTVTTPEPGYTGQVGNVVFADGVATVDEDTHAAELAYFRGRGYGVEPVEGNDSEPGGVEAAWRAYAVTHGMSAEEAEEFTRDQLVERFVVTEETAS